MSKRERLDNGPCSKRNASSVIVKDNSLFGIKGLPLVNEGLSIAEKISFDYHGRRTSELSVAIKSRALSS